MLFFLSFRQNKYVLEIPLYPREDAVAVSLLLLSRPHSSAVLLGLVCDARLPEAERSRAARLPSLRSPSCHPSKLFSTSFKVEWEWEEVHVETVHPGQLHVHVTLGLPAAFCLFPEAKL